MAGTAGGPSTAQDPGHVLAGILQPLLGLAQAWSAGAPLPDVGPDLLDQAVAGRLTRVLAGALPGDAFADLADACATDDDRARRAATAAAGWLGSQLHPVNDGVRALLATGQHAEAAGFAALFADLATVLGVRGGVFAFAELAARAAWRQDLPEQAAQWCGRCLADADGVPADRRAAVHDLYALALTRLDRLPEALAQYEQALALPMSTADRQTARTNRASLLITTGHLRAAVRELEDVVRTGRVAGGVPLGTWLDTLAQALLAAGDLTAAAAAAEEAAGLLAPAPVGDRLVNLAIGHEIARAAGRAQAARALFERAYRLVQDTTDGELDEDGYRAGLHAVLDAPAPDSAAAVEAFVEAVQRRGVGDPNAARAAFTRARRLAEAAGDGPLALRAGANLAAVLFETGAPREAARLADGTRRAAAARRLAAAEAAAAGTVVSGLVRDGAASGRPQVLRLGLRALALGALHDRLARQTLTAAGPRAQRLRTTVALGLVPLGAVHTELGLFCRDVGDHPGLAAAHLRAAVEWADRTQDPRGLGLRLANLANTLARQSDPGAAAELAAVRERLAGLLAPGTALPPDTRCVIGLALQPVADDATPAGVVRLEELAQDVERIRAAAGSPHARAAVDDSLGPQRRLPRALLALGRDRAAWERLHALRHRELLEVLTAQRGRAGYLPPDLAEASDLLATAGPGTALLDVTVEADRLVAFLLRSGALERLDLPGTLDEVTRASWGEPLGRARELAAATRSSPLLGALVRWVTDRTGPDVDLLLSVDEELANLPLHLVPVDGQPWSARQTLGHLPSIALLRSEFGSRSVAGAAVFAGDSRGDLPGAEQECREAARWFGGQPLLGPACTLPALRGAIEGRDLGIVHLAVHGFGDPRSGGRCTVLFADPDGGAPVWVPYADLAALAWRARVVVFSGCSTGVGGPRFGERFTGLTAAALRDGAGAVVSSLWPVDDLRTAALMTAFYADLAEQLRSGRADLRLALRRAAARQAGPEAAPAPPWTRSARELEIEQPDPDPAQDELALTPADAFVVTGVPFLLP